MLDIGDKRQLLEYLRGKDVFKDIDGTRVVYFPGGVSGIVAMVSDGEKDVIVKQALARLKVKDVWECDPGRIITEHEAHEVYARLVPESVPPALFADRENNVIGRIGAPDGTPMWKTQLLAGLLDFRVAAKAMDALLRIHNLSAADGEIQRRFADNTIFYELRISPYIEKTVAAHPELRERSAKVIDRLMTEKLVLNHGDYSPKNILVDGDRIYILDYEVAHMGHPSFDLAFFFNHFMLKAVKNREFTDSYCNMLLFMAKRYFDGVTVMPAALLAEQTAELLGFMLLARVDGKSPAEYIVSDEDKQTVRDAAFAIFRTGAEGIPEAVRVLKAALRLHRPPGNRRQDNHQTHTGKESQK